jgi:hypothetical protein
MADDLPIERTPAQARQATTRGHVVRILAISMALALVAMVAVLAWVYLVHGDPLQ